MEVVQARWVSSSLCSASIPIWAWASANSSHIKFFSAILGRSPPLPSPPITFTKVKHHSTSFKFFTSWFCPAAASLLLRRAVSVGAASNKEVGASSSKEGQRFVTPMGNFCKKFKTEVCNNNHPWNICKSSKNDVSSFGGEPCYRKEKKGFANLRPEKPIPTASTDNTAPL